MKKNLMKETKSELKKVVWTPKKDVINGTVVVVAMVVIVGAIILAFDFLSGLVVKNIIERDVPSYEEMLKDLTVTDGSTESDNENELDNSENNVENTDNKVEENSEPTIDSEVVAE